MASCVAIFVSRGREAGRQGGREAGRQGGREARSQVGKEGGRKKRGKGIKSL